MGVCEMNKLSVDSEAGASTGEESEEGVSWMLQTAHLFLTSINLGSAEDEQKVPDYELDSELHLHSNHSTGHLSDVDFLTKKPSELNLKARSRLDPQFMVIDGKSWRPTVITEPVAFLSSHRVALSVY